MAIVLRPAGEAAAAAQTGAIIGQAEKAKREQEIALQREAEDRARKWELEKMTLNSQQAFAHEMRMAELDQAKFERAKAWEIEKLETASRIDFQRKETERQRKLSILSNQLEEMEKQEREDESLRNDPTAQARKQEIQNQILSVETGREFRPKTPQIPGIGDIGNLQNPLVRAMVLEKIQPGLASATPEEQAEILGSEVAQYLRIQREAPEVPTAAETKIPTGRLTPEQRQLQDYQEYYRTTLEAGNTPITLAQWQKEHPMPSRFPYSGIGFALAGVPQLYQEQGQPLDLTQYGPIRITSKEEYDELPSGTSFIDPQGNQRRKP